MTACSAITGDDRPKQVCPILGRETLLEQTRRRVRLLVAPERLLTLVTRRHERSYTPLLGDAAPRSVIVQPENRGTDLAVLPVSGLGWNDLGDPRRVLATREQAQAVSASA